MHSHSPGHHTANCGANCQVHDIAWDADVANGWVFTNLSSIGQIVTVRATAPHYQTPFYRLDANYKPLELEIGSSE